MTIKNKLTLAMKNAMREKDKEILATIRMVIDRVQKKEKELLRDLSEEESVQIIQTFKKQIQEEMDSFKLVGNLERVEGLRLSRNLLDIFLPQQMTREEIDVQVQLVISEITSSGQTPNKGVVMKNLMPLVKGKADNSLVNQVVTERLAVA